VQELEGSWSQLTTKDSRTLASTGNKEIGRQSDEIDLGGLIFGAGKFNTFHMTFNT